MLLPPQGAGLVLKARRPVSVLQLVNLRPQRRSSWPFASPHSPSRSPSLGLVQIRPGPPGFIASSWADLHLTPLPVPLLCARFHVFTGLGPRSGSLVSRKSVVPAFVVWPPGVTPIYCASAATCPVKAGDDTAGPRGEGKGRAPRTGEVTRPPSPALT